MAPETLSSTLQTVLMVAPRGFCAGVVRAVDIVDEALKAIKPVYVRKEIVHNKFVVEDLQRKGAIFVNELSEVPDGMPGTPVVCIFSAHGVSPAVREEARRKHLFILDATCPLVTKVHLQAIRYAKMGYHIVLIGHHGHEEVEGTLGEAPHAMHLVDSLAEVEHLQLPPGAKLAYLTQTTLSVDDTHDIALALKRKFPQLEAPPTESICYATTNRQAAVKQLAPLCDLILVIGAQNSSNSQRLREVAEDCGTRAFLIDGPEALRPEWFADVRTVGVTAGASAPEVLVTALLDNLRARGATEVRTLDIVEENMFFPLPKSLKQLPVIA